jgi:membrane protease YdiL (CAAX protease family)
MIEFDDQPPGHTTPAQPAAEAVPEPERRWPVWGYQDVLVIALLALPCLALASLAVLGLARLIPVAIPGKATPLIAAQFLGFALLFLCLKILLRARYGLTFWDAMEWWGPPRGIIRAMFLGPPLALGVAMVGAVMGEEHAEMPILELLKDPVSIVIVGIAAVTIGPLCEELAFRGFLLPVLVRSFGAAAGVVLAALPFALLHGPQYGWSWPRVALILAAGIAFGVVRLRAGSTLAATVMHASYNLTFFTAFLAQKGFDIRNG